MIKLTYTLADLDATHARALTNFAAANGRTWKDALGLCWYRAAYPDSGDEGCYLQALRNSPKFGPGTGWLEKLKLPVLTPTHNKVIIAFVRDTEEFRVFPAGLSKKREEAIAYYDTDYESAIGTARAMAGPHGVIVNKVLLSKRTID